jgi:hypothetical protein
MRRRRAPKFARFSSFEIFVLLGIEVPEMATPSIGTRLISAGEAAELLDLTHERLRQLARDGWIPKAVKGKYPLEATVQGYIQFLTDESRRSAQSKADAELKAAKTREIELRIADRESRLIDLCDVDALVARHISIYRTELASVPSEATRNPEMRRLIADALTAAVSRFEDRYRVAREAMRAGRDPLDS